jgi:hypothetical protein
MKTDPVLPVGLEALPATWRAKALDLRLMHLYPQAQLCEMHASELETVLSAEPRQQEDIIGRMSTEAFRAEHANDAPVHPHDIVRFSQKDMDRATKPLHVEIEKLKREATEPRPPAAAVDLNTVLSDLRVVHGDTCPFCDPLEEDDPPCADCQGLFERLRAALAAPREETEQADGSRI